MLIALALVAGIALGGLAVLLLLRPILRERNAMRVELRDCEQQLAIVQAQLATAESGLDDRVRDAFKAISAEAYRETNETFLQLAQAKLDGTVKPLAESLVKMEEQVQSLDRARAQSYGALREQLTTLSTRTETLANALRTPHVRGRWGEIQLRRVVELAGMLPYCDFVEQVTTMSNGGRLRPDLIVRLPGEKQVVVDAKVPLAAYLEAHEARDDDTRAAKLADHARQVRDHLQKLSAKSYWQQFADSPDYVVMFLPDEGFFRSAWEQDPELVELGVRHRVHIASPTTLIVLLQAIAFGWQQEKVAEDARTVHELGRRLYERLCVMGSHLTKLGASLDRAVGSYNQTVSSLESRVLVTARELEKHVSSDKELEQLTPVSSATVALAAPELTLDDAPPFEVLPGNAA